MGGSALGRDAVPQDGDRLLRTLRQLAGAHKSANGELFGVFGRHAHLDSGFLHRLYKVENISWARARNRSDRV